MDSERDAILLVEGKKKKGHRFRKELTDPFLLSFKLTTQLKDIRNEYAKCIVLGLTDGSSCFCSR